MLRLLPGTVAAWSDSYVFMAFVDDTVIASAEKFLTLVISISSALLTPPALRPQSTSLERDVLL